MSSPLGSTTWLSCLRARARRTFFPACDVQFVPKRILDRGVEIDHPKRGPGELRERDLDEEKLSRCFLCSFRTLDHPATVRARAR